MLVLNGVGLIKNGQHVPVYLKIKVNWKEDNNNEQTRNDMSGIYHLQRF